jgi:phosphonate degradation associated HDIG domain protein
VNDLLALYASPAARRMYDEAVTELDHALQTAALARAEGAADHLVAAALLHDVGHLVSDDNVTLDDALVEDFHHERVGARHLARWFGPEITTPVALHVAAKRYLCTVEVGYLDALSPSSVRSLGLQGGPMSAAEVAAFERRSHHGAAVQVRRWDDRAKVAGLDVGCFADHLELLARVARPR